MIKKIVMIMMLILNIISFSEIPHTYIYDNPEKAITTAETLKKKPNGAEMNISVTKVKSEELQGFIFKDNRLIISSRKLKDLNNLEIFDKNKKRVPYRVNNNYVYVESKDIKTESLLVKDGAKYYKLNLLQKASLTADRSSNRVINEEVYLELNDKYTGGYINFLDGVYPAGIKVVSSNITRDYFPMAQDYYLVERIDVGSEDRYIETTIFSKLNPTINFVLNGATTAVNNISWTGVSNPYGLLKFSTANNINIGDGIILGTQDETKIYDRSDKRDSYSKLKIKFQEHPRKSFTFYLKQKYAYRLSQLGPPSFSNYFDADYTLKINVNYKPDTLIGSSALTFNENYNKSFVNFNADNNGSSLAVENSVPGLSFGTSGAGIAFLQQGDILEVNGSRVTIGASGNLGETQGSIGTLGYKYKAENGKLRLALTNWGVLEPSRTFEVKVLKGGAEAVRHTFTIQAPKRVEGTSRVKFVETYPNTQFVAFNGVSLNSPTALSLENSVTGVTLESSTGAGLVTMQQGDILEINGVQNQIGASGTLGEKNISLGSLALNYVVQGGKLRIRPISWGVQEPQREATVRIIRGTNEISKQVISIQAPKKVEGNSRLTLREYYSINDYIAFNGVSLDNPLSLALENSLRDVTLESSTGAGIVTMLQGDILDINGVQNQIGASGNLGEKETTIDTLRFAYKVEAGKLRVKVLDWGVLEPRRDIRIKVKRGTNEISIHTLNIKSPTKVEGDTSLKFDNTYKIRNNVKFNAINLETYGRLSMQSLQGVILENTTGSGIPFMNQGDKIYISDNFTAKRSKRAVFADNYYEIGASGTLAKQNIKLTNGEVGVQVEGGKLNLALNNWTVNKNVNVRVQIVRGTNQIMDHTFTLKAPDAPFNIISQGVLDFGTIIAGAKNRTAETDIKIEMIKDVTDIQFKLNTDSPELYNKNGTTLRARNLQALVSQQANRRYLVKIQGKLDVPENQELGEYSGSLILEMKIK